MSRPIRGVDAAVVNKRWKGDFDPRLPIRCSFCGISEKDMGTSSEPDNLYKWSIYSMPPARIKCKSGMPFGEQFCAKEDGDFKATTPKPSSKTEANFYRCHRAFSLLCAQ